MPTPIILFLYAAVMARRVARPCCLEFKRWATGSDFWTVSAASVRMSSMWQGLDMYGLI